MRLMILTGADAGMSALKSACEPSKRLWAETHEAEFTSLCSGDFPQDKGHPSFQKLRWIYSLFDHYDTVFWMDADSAITDTERNPYAMATESRKAGAFLTVSGDYKRPHDDGRPLHNQWSAGHMIWHRSPKAFKLLRLAMERTEFAWNGLWDQDALQTITHARPELRPRVMPPRYMNSVLPGLTGWEEADWKPGDFLCHFTGTEYKDRLGLALRFIKDPDAFKP